MKHQEIQALLGEFVDNTLEAAQHHQISDHLGNCPTCREEIAFLRQLHQQASQLPQNIEPPRDMWPQIADRLEPQKAAGVELAQAPPRRVWGWRLLALAAGIALMVASSLTTYKLTANRQPTHEPTPPTAVSNELTINIERLDSDYSTALAELTKALQLRRHQLSPETLATVEKNLQVIDRAIAEASQALATDPGHPDLLLALVSMYERKVDLLQYLTHLPQGL